MPAIDEAHPVMQSDFRLIVGQSIKLAIPNTTTKSIGE
jgi:hypothetical protein